MSRKIEAKDLIDKIEKLAKERMAENQVVDLSSLRKLKNQKERPSVIVIEDDEMMRMNLQRILESEGIEVRSAADGTQLGQVLGDRAVDLIIMDVGLPWINGFELAKLMKAHPVLKGIPLIFVSGHTSDQDVKKGFEAGADDYIKKPFDIDKVKKSVFTLLELNRKR